MQTPFHPPQAPRPRCLLPQQQQCFVRPMCCGFVCCHGERPSQRQYCSAFTIHPLPTCSCRTRRLLVSFAAYTSLPLGRLSGWSQAVTQSCPAPCLPQPLIPLTHRPLSPSILPIFSSPSMHLPPVSGLRIECACVGQRSVSAQITAPVAGAATGKGRGTVSQHECGKCTEGGRCHIGITH